jgi:urea transport system permease protein
MGFGGNNGMTDYKDLLGFNVQAKGTRIGLYVTSVLALGGAFLLCRYVVTSKLGRVLLALKDAESRVRFLGYQADNAKLFVFTLSAVLAGLAGALYVPQVGIINPSEFSPANSIEVAIWVAVGGRGTLVGAILGAGVVNYLKTWLTGAAPDLWLFALGGLFIAVTLLIPHGIVGLLRKFRLPRPEAAAVEKQA